MYTPANNKQKNHDELVKHNIKDSIKGEMKTVVRQLLQNGYYVIKTFIFTFYIPLFTKDPDGNLYFLIMHMFCHHFDLILK